MKSTISAIKLTLIIITVLFISENGFGQDPLQFPIDEITPNPPVTPSGMLIDRFNNVYSPTNLGNLKTSNQAINCSGFIVDFEDVILGNGLGFNDQTPSPCTSGLTLGEERINTVCSLFAYVAKIIDLGGANPEILFTVSDTSGTGALASASALYFDTVTSGIVGGFVYDRIVLLGGTDPDNDTNTYDATINVDFGTRFLGNLPVPWNSCFTACAQNKIDLYSIILHEVTHTLGFASFVGKTGASIQTGLITGPYTVYDQRLYDNGLSFNLISFPSTFVGIAPDDLIESWFFDPGNSEEHPLFAEPYSLTPPPVFQPSSFSHFDVKRSEFQYVMRPSTSGGNDRFYTQPEIEVLQNLGYTINTSNLPNAGSVYPIGSDDFGNTTIGQQVCINVLGNDTDPNGTLFISDCNMDLCTGILAPPSILIINGGGSATVNGDSICYTPDAGFVGTAHLQYCIADGLTADSLVNIINTVDVYVEVQGTFCPDDVCNYVCNGSFEAGQGTCDPPGLGLFSSNGFPNSPVNNWYSSVGTPYLCIRGIQLCNPQPTGNPQWFDIPDNPHATSTGAPIPTHNAPNDRYIAIRSTPSPVDYIEGVLTKLINTLTPGNQYRLTLWAYSKIEGGGSTFNTLMFFLNDSLPIHGLGFSQTIGDFNIVTGGVNQSTGIDVPQNTWTFLDTSFIAPTNTTGEQFLIIEPKFGAPSQLSIVIDDVRLIDADPTKPNIIIEKILTSVPQFRHGDTVNYEISICNVDSILDGFNVTVEDFLGPGLNLISSSFNSFPTHNLGTLLTGECDTLVLSATIDSSVAFNEGINNCVLLTSGGNCGDTASSQMCSIVTVASTDISVIKTVDKDSVLKGDTVIYSIFIGNNGGAVATNVLVEDVITPDATIESFSAPGATLTVNNNTVQILYNTIDIGVENVVELTIVINTNCGKIIQNCADLISIDEVEEGISNNSSCTNIVVGSGSSSSSSFVIDFLSSSPETCADSCNGVTTVFVCGGLPPYTYQWDDPSNQTNQSAVDLCVGAYSVTVVDSIGTTIIASAVVLLRPLLAFVATEDASSCISSDGTAVAIALLGLPPYTYLWSTGDTTDSIAGLTAGFYFVTITDAFGCSGVGFNSLNDPTLDVSPNTNPCPGIIGPANPDTNFFYEWAPTSGLSDPFIANPFANPSTTTTYQLTIFDPINSCLNVSSYTVQVAFDIIDTTITGIEVWDIPLSIKGLVTVESGARLTIKNTTISFGKHLNPLVPDAGIPATGILVKDGGELIVNNAVLTSLSCEGVMWTGIQVWGDPCLNCPINQLNPGKVTIVGGSEIRNARTGVLANRIPPPHVATPVPNFGAGYVTAVVSSFVDCRIGIELSKSIYPSKSKILGCTFTNNKLLKDQIEFLGENTDAFIVINQINDVTVAGCTFNSSNIFDIGDRSTGIRSFDAGYIATSNSFGTLTKGIDASGTGIVTGVIMRNNTFTDTRQSITSQGNNYDEISSNTFNVLDGEVIGVDTFPTWAVFMYNTTGFLVTLNTINTDNTITDNTYGVVVRNSDGLGGQVYKNEFSGAFSVATQIEQDNSILQVGCNGYADVSAFDWAVTSGVLDEQGACNPSDNSSPAGNLFHPGCSGQGHIFKDGSVPTFVYNSHASIPPTCNSGGVTVLPCAGTVIDTANIDNACPSLFTGGGNPGPDTTGNGGVVQGQFISLINKTKDTKEKLLLHNGLIRFAIIRGETDFAIQRLLSLNTVTSAKILVAQYVHTRETQKAIKELKKIPVAGNENIRFKELFEKLIEIRKKGQNLKNISMADEAVIRDVANSETKVSVKAEAVLVMIEKEKYNRQPERINQQGLKMAGNNNNGITIIEDGDPEQLSLDLKSVASPTITLAPNPFKESTTITYQLPFSTEYGEIVIYNTVGHIVDKYKVIGSGQIEYYNSHLSAGIYVCNYIHGNRVVKSLKMVIIK